MPDGGKNLEAFQACLRAPFATLGITTTDTHVTGIRYLAASVAARAPRRNTIAFLACVQIQTYLDDPSFRFELPLMLSGTHHRLAVWEAMQRIPAGATRTYGDLAKELGSSPRAVGGA
jgi:methylated-DNA-[protein]-cysteine S-methyltransferase